MELTKITEIEFTRAELWHWYDPRRYIRKELAKRDITPEARGVLFQIQYFDFPNLRINYRLNRFTKQEYRGGIYKLRRKVGRILYK